MIDSDKTAGEIARLLLQIKAIKLNIQKPFTWSSGIKSPIYCDNRITLSYPKIRSLIKRQLSEKILLEFGQPEAIAGVATAGIAHGALIADVLNLPFVYVRSQPKSHGLTNTIEGRVEKGQKVVVVEDLISTGQSSLNVVEQLRQAECRVLGLTAIFTYGFEMAEKNFEQAHCKFATLSNYEVLIEQALEEKYIRQEDMEVLRQWRKNFGKQA